MATIITDGSTNCRRIYLLQCPACDRAFDQLRERKYIKSETLGDEVMVCLQHGDVCTVEEEVKVQDALARAIKNSDGMISKDGKAVKLSDIEKKYNL